jgi:DNA-binding CsgD family transcriptional regulator
VGGADAAPTRLEQAGDMIATLTTPTRLTPRELQIATLIAYGYTNGEIAARLEISVRTAEMHRANARRKLGFESRAEIVRWALDNRLLV